MPYERPYDRLPLEQLFQLQRKYAIRLKQIGDAIYRELRREWREKNPPDVPHERANAMKEEASGGQKGE